MYKIKMSDLEKLSKVAKSFKGQMIFIQEETNKIFITDLEDYFFVPAITTGDKITLKYEKQFDTIVSFFKKQKVDEVEVNQENFKSGSIVFNHLFCQKDNRLDISLLNEKEYQGILHYNILDYMISLLPFSSKDNQRYVLNGVAIKDGAIVATDGRRLSKYIFRDESVNIIISNKTIKICDMIFKNKILGVKINDKFICFSDGQSEYFGRFIDGVFPNWKQVMPEDKKIKYTYFIENGNDLFELVERLKIKAKKEDIKRLNFYFNDNKIEIWNEIDMKLEYITKNITGQEPIIVPLNQNYLDFLKDTKTVKISFVDNQSPIQFEDEVRRTIIMPMREI